MATTTLKGQPFDRPILDSMLRRRMFYTPSFEIYGGIAGLFDYGPVRCNPSIVPLVNVSYALILFWFLFGQKLTTQLYSLAAPFKQMWLIYGENILF